MVLAEQLVASTRPTCRRLPRPRGASGHVRGGRMKCTQPGCTGTIVDGYCDVCGSPGPAEALRCPARPSPAAPPRPRRPAVDGAPCTQPGCTGTIVDGYCDVCGTPGAAAAPAGDDDRAPVASRRLGLHDHRRLQPAAVDRARLAAGAAAVPRSPGGCSSGSQRLRSARLGAGLTRVPPAPGDRRGPGDHEESGGAGGQAQLPELRRPVGRSRDGQPGRTEGFCPKCGNPFSFTPKLQAGRPGRQPVRGGRLPGPRRSRLDLPGPGPQRVRPLGGARRAC